MKFYNKNNELIFETIVEDSSYQNKVLMGENILYLAFSLPQPFDFVLGNYCNYAGEVYTLNKLPSVTEHNTRNYAYKMILESSRYELSKCQYATGFPDVVDTVAVEKPPYEFEFDLTGPAEIFLELLIRNLHKINPDWTLEVDVEKFSNLPQTITFSNENCSSVLKKIADTFKAEFEITNHHIYFGKVEIESEIKLGYGKGKGLVELTRTNYDESNVVTKLYPYGSNRNLNRQKYLAFKNEQITNPAEQLFIAPKYLLPHPGQSVAIGDETFTVSADMSLNRNQDKYGQIEASKQFEAIYPGNEDYTVDEVIEVSNEDSFYDIVSNAIDFNIEEVVDGNSTYRIVGEDAVIHFNSGQLGEYEFPFKHDASNNHLELVPIEVESYKIPKYPVVPAVGDKFIITGIAMPDSMIDAAESQLLIEAAKYLLENSEPRVAYSAKVSEIYFHQQYPDLIVTPGMYVSLNASRLGGGEAEQIRIINIKKYINYKSRYEFQLSNYVSVNAFARLVADVKDTETKIQIGDKTTSAAYKRGMLAYDYLKKALEQDTQIKGGLVLSSLIELLLNGEVRSGINGLDIEGENSIYLWAGGTLQQAIEFLKMKQGLEYGDMGGIKFVVTFGGNIYCNDGFFNDGNFVNGYFSGKFTSNSSGNKVLIDPDVDKKIRLIDENDNEVGALGFFAESGYAQGRFNLYHKDQDGNVIHTLSVSPYFMQIFDSSGNGVYVSGQGGVALIKLDNLPTSGQDLSSGRIWRDGNNLKIV